MNIVITDAHTITENKEAFQVFELLGTVTLYPSTSPEEVRKRVKDANIILCNKTPMTEETLKEAKHLKYIGLFATGYNNVDLSFTKKNGITVCNAGSYSTQAVAQHTLAFILNHFNQVLNYHQFVQEGGWMRSTTFSPIIFEMAEMTSKVLGIIGYGSIGRAVSKLARAFGMKVLVYQRHPKEEDGVEMVDFDTLLSESDVISVHCPLNEESEKMFHREVFAKCKKGAYFINTARGPIVDEEALKEALVSGHLSGAAIDVLETEPMKENCVLFHAPNLVITPHVAWAPKETRMRLIDLVYQNLQAFLDGKPIHVVE